MRLKLCGLLLIVSVLGCGSHIPRTTSCQISGYLHALKCTRDGKTTFQKEYKDADAWACYSGDTITAMFTHIRRLEAKKPSIRPRMEACMLIAPIASVICTNDHITTYLLTDVEAEAKAFACWSESDKDKILTYMAELEAGG